MRFFFLHLILSLKFSKAACKESFEKCASGDLFLKGFEYSKKSKILQKRAIYLSDH